MIDKLIKIMEDVVVIQPLPEGSKSMFGSSLYQIPKDGYYVPVKLINTIQELVINFLLQFLVVEIKHDRYYYCNIMPDFRRKMFEANSIDDFRQLIWYAINQYFTAQFKNDEVLNIDEFSDGTLFTWKVDDYVIPYMWDSIFERGDLFKIIMQFKNSTYNQRKAVNSVKLFVKNMFHNLLKI